MDFFGTSPLIYLNTILQSIAETFELLALFFVFVGAQIAFYIMFKLVNIIKMAIMDKSYKLFGVFYIRNVPYKGYNRWRSKEWNRRNTM